jgi:hypothetical protein
VAGLFAPCVCAAAERPAAAAHCGAAGETRLDRACCCGADDDHRPADTGPTTASAAVLHPAAAPAPAALAYIQDTGPRLPAAPAATPPLRQVPLRI